MRHTARSAFLADPHPRSSGPCPRCPPRGEVVVSIVLEARTCARHPHGPSMLPVCGRVPLAGHWAEAAFVVDDGQCQCPVHRHGLGRRRWRPRQQCCGAHSARRHPHLDLAAQGDVAVGWRTGPFRPAYWWTRAPPCAAGSCGCSLPCCRGFCPKTSPIATHPRCCHPARTCRRPLWPSMAQSQSPFSTRMAERTWTCVTVVWNGSWGGVAVWPSPHASQRTFSQLLSGSAGAAMFAAAQGGMRGGGEARVRVGYGRGRQPRPRTPNTVPSV